MYAGTVPCLCLTDKTDREEEFTFEISSQLPNSKRELETAK